MKRKPKLIYSILCILIVLISLSGCDVEISDDNTDNFDYDKFDFEEIEGGYEMSQKILTGLFSSNKYEGVLQIPETYEKKPIKAISSIEHILKEESSISNVIEDESNTTSTDIEQPQNNVNIGSIIASIVVGIVIIVLCVFLIIGYKNKKIVAEKSIKKNKINFVFITIW